jgi:hypothetical protein
MLPVIFAYLFFFFAFSANIVPLTMRKTCQIFLVSGISLIGMWAFVVLKDLTKLVH